MVGQSKALFQPLLVNTFTHPTLSPTPTMMISKPVIYSKPNCQSLSDVFLKPKSSPSITNEPLNSQCYGINFQ